MVDVIPIPTSVIARTSGRDVRFPVVAYVGMEDGKCVGRGGLAWADGSCWLWLEGVDPEHRHALRLVREAKKMLKIAARYGDEVVFAVRDDHEPMSAKLLTLLGFVHCGTELTDKGEQELWVCQVLKPSQQ
jgi:hypothetical protein